MAVTNDWGKGVENNTIGWGKSADNATNGFGEVYESSAAGDTLLESGGAGAAPVISGVPTISSETQVGETITATPASVTGTPTPTTSWQWERSSDGVTGWANISGATASTYTLVSADDTKYVRAVQTETNASGSDSANSAASSQIVGYDADAVAYFTAASITDVTEKDAANQLVLDLKGTGSTTNNTDVWSDMLAFYPVSPTSLAAAAFNLKDPVSYEITWFNSPTHSDAGVGFDGTTQYGDTGLTPSTSLSLNDSSVGFKSTGSAATVAGALGVIQSTSKRILTFFNGTAKLTHLFRTGSSQSTSFTYTDRDSFFATSRRASNDIESYEDGISQVSKTGSGAGTLPDINVFIGAANSSGTPTTHFDGTIQTTFMGNGLTDDQVTDLYDAITTYNANVISGGR